MVNIQLSSNKNAKNKMAEYFAFVNEVVGIFFERESIIAHQYFLDRKKVSILEKFHKGMPKDRLLKKLDNIAWDMAAPRFMENTIPSMSKTGNGRYFIPMFVSFDVKLKELLSLYPIKGAIYSKTSGKLIPIPTINTFLYFEKNDCSKNLEYFFSDSVKETREKKPLHSRTSVHECIKHEYEKLRHTVSL